MANKYVGVLPLRVRAASQYLSSQYNDEKANYNNTRYTSDTISSPTPRAIQRKANDVRVPVTNEILRPLEIAISYSQSGAAEPIGFATNQLRSPHQLQTLSNSASSPQGLEEVESNLITSFDLYLAQFTADSRGRPAADYESITLNIGKLYGIDGDIPAVGKSEAIHKAVHDKMAKEEVEFKRYVRKDVSWTRKHNPDTNQYDTVGSLVIEQIKTEKKSVDEYATEIRLYVYETEGTGDYVFLHEPDPSDVTSTFGKARKDASDYERQLGEALVDQRTGKTPNWPGDRPASTKDARLSAEERDAMDDWWENNDASRNAAKKAKPSSPDSTYDKYAEAGGALSKEEFLAALEIAKSQSSTKEKSWLETLAELIGLTVDKTGDVVLGLGKDGVDLLKSWGPVGTVGAYAGAKAANKALGSNGVPDWVIFAGLGLGVLLVLK